MDEPEDRSRLTPLLDGAEAVASLIYVVLLSVIAVAVLAAVGYLALNPPRSWGSQGEWLYVVIAFLLIISWLIGQLTWLLKRRRRRRDSDETLRMPAPNIQINPSGLSFEWGSLPTADAHAARQKALTWSFQSGPIATTTFELDQTQVAAARAARDAGQSWEAIAKQVKPDYASLSSFEQSLYQRALQLAVDASK